MSNPHVAECRNRISDPHEAVELASLILFYQQECKLVALQQFIARSFSTTFGVGDGARIQRAILEDTVHIADGAEIGVDLNTDRKYGFVTDSGIVVIPANRYVGSSSPTAVPPHVKWRTGLAKNARSITLRSEVSNPTESREIDNDETTRSRSLPTFS